jgi:hypothetical protein
MYNIYSLGTNREAFHTSFQMAYALVTRAAESTHCATALFHAAHNEAVSGC